MEIVALIGLFLTATGAQEGQLEGPENTLGVVGSSVTLKCLSPSSNCNGTEWLKYSGGNPMTVFSHQGIISIAFRERYRVENKSGCNLIIKNVELTDAGRFLCRSIISSNTDEKTAYLMILATQPKCSINASQDRPNIAEGDGLLLTCEVTYNGTDRPSMFWKGVKDASAAVVKNKTISRTYSVVAPAPEVPSFICNISLEVEAKDNNGGIQGLATNIPVTTCATPAIDVLYSVRSINLSPSFAVYSPGTIITCTAEGNPAPSFKWQVLEWKTNATWQNIPNATHHEFSQYNVGLSQFRCLATNVLRGKLYAETSTAFQILQSGELTSTTSNSEDRAGVGIGIGFGMGFLVAILLASMTFVVFVRLRLIEFHPRPANKPLDGVVQPIEQEISPSSRQLSVMYASIPEETEAPLVGEQESTYASLREDRVAIEYESLEQRRKTKHEKSPDDSPRYSTLDT